MDAGLRARLASQIARAGVILFTGAGISHADQKRVGDSIPRSCRVRDLLWEIAFPGEAIDTRSTLGDTFGVATRTRERAVRELLEQWLDVDPRTLPEFYGTWFAAP